MFVARLSHPVDFEGWRGFARRFAQALVAPSAIDWRVGDHDIGLFGEDVVAGGEGRRRAGARLPKSTASVGWRMPWLGPGLLEKSSAHQVHAAR
jgi:hypothetical protein